METCGGRRVFVELNNSISIRPFSARTRLDAKKSDRLHERTKIDALN